MNNKWDNMPLIPVSWGEVFDKLTILNIKLEKIKETQKVENISNEKKHIEKVVGDISKFPIQLKQYIDELYNINLSLWDIEESKREYEKKQNFDENFIKLAREVYIQNDKRASIKKNINLLLNSNIIEEKSHKTD